MKRELDTSYDSTDNKRARKDTSSEQQNQQESDQFQQSTSSAERTYKHTRNLMSTEAAQAYRDAYTQRRDLLPSESSRSSIVGMEYTSMNPQPSITEKVEADVKACRERYSDSLSFSYEYELDPKDIIDMRKYVYHHVLTAEERIRYEQEQPADSRQSSIPEGVSLNQWIEGGILRHLADDHRLTDRRAFLLVYHNDLTREERIRYQQEQERARYEMDRAIEMQKMAKLHLPNGSETIPEIKKYLAICLNNLDKFILDDDHIMNNEVHDDEFMKIISNSCKEVNRSLDIIKFRRQYPTAEDILKEYRKNVPQDLEAARRDLSDKYWRGVARQSAEREGKQLTDEAFETYYQNVSEEVDQKIQKLFEKAEVWMRRKPEALIKTLEWRCGRFTTSINASFEDTGDVTYIPQRDSSEKAIHGYPEDMPIELRILYAYATEDLNGKPDSPNMKHFGSIAIHFKPEVKRRSTALLGDPWLTTDGVTYLDGRSVPYNKANRDCFLIPWQDMDEEDPHTLNTSFKRRVDANDLKGSLISCQMMYDDPRNITSIDDFLPWSEVQIHGGLTIDDIEEVVFLEPIPQDTKKTLTDLLVKHGVFYRDYISESVDREPQELVNLPKKKIKPQVFETARQNFLGYLPENLGDSPRLTRNTARDLFAQMLRHDNGGLVSDIDETLIDRRGGLEAWSTMPKGFIESAERLVNDGIPVAIITGRPIEGVIEALKNGGANKDLIDKLEIYGEYGMWHRGPSTDGEIKVGNEKAEKYIHIAEEVLDTISKRINEDSELKEFKDYIELDSTELGATVYNSALAELLRNHLKEEKGQKDEDIEEKIEFIGKKLNEIVSGALEEKDKDRVFCKDHTNAAGIKICLNKDTTGIEISKGTAVASLVKKLRLRSVVAFGDDIPDLDMNRALLRFIAINNYVDDYRLRRDERLDLLKKSISKLTEQRVVPTEDQIEKRNKLNEEFLFLHRSTLESQAFVGVTHPEGMRPTEDAIIEASTLMLKDPDDTVNFITEVTDKIREMKK